MMVNTQLRVEYFTKCEKFVKYFFFFDEIVSFLTASQISGFNRRRRVYEGVTTRRVVSSILGTDKVLSFQRRSSLNRRN